MTACLKWEKVKNWKVPFIIIISLSFFTFVGKSHMCYERNGVLTYNIENDERRAI